MKMLKTLALAFAFAAGSLGATSAALACEGGDDCHCKGKDGAKDCPKDCAGEGKECPHKAKAKAGKKAEKAPEKQ